jgi:hypothetical protein
MKNKTIIIAIACSLSFLAACTGGDHNPKSGDTTSEGNKYHAKDTSKVDTAKITSSDHSASGGSDLIKDSSKMVKPKQ